LMKTDEALLARKLIEHIRRISTRPVRLMEFCGGHTVAILKNGLRQLLPESVHLFSGPGCPVCVTATGDIDKIIALAQQPGVIVATFGDLMRVPGSYATLQQTRAQGHDVRVVYSALEALDLARANPSSKVIMTGIGFETTAPTIAASLVQATEEKLGNYLVFSLHKLTPPVMQAILRSGEMHLDGIICPGHVSAIIGPEPYEAMAREHGVACVIMGFEPLDILLGVDMLVKQIESHQPRVEIAYRRAVRPGGNPNALALMGQVFETTGADWRGMGVIPGSGLHLKEEFRDFDASAAFKLPEMETREPKGCICAEILRGLQTPQDCKLFGSACTPEHPVGPCMVSAEGACSAHYLYSDIQHE
jgi:hydrogenase expression/formation protein HypD